MLVKPPPTVVIQHWMECLVAVSRWLWLHLDLLLCAARCCSRLYKGSVKTDPWTQDERCWHIHQHSYLLLFAVVVLSGAFSGHKLFTSYWSYIYIYMYIFVVSTEAIFKYLLPASSQYTFSKESQNSWIFNRANDAIMCFTILEEPLNSTGNEDFSRMLTHSTFNL